MSVTPCSPPSVGNDRCSARCSAVRKKCRYRAGLTEPGYSSGVVSSPCRNQPPQACRGGRSLLRALRSGLAVVPSNCRGVLRGSSSERSSLTAAMVRRRARWFVPPDHPREADPMSMALSWIRRGPSLDVGSRGGDVSLRSRGRQSRGGSSTSATIRGVAAVRLADGERPFRVYFSTSRCSSEPGVPCRRFRMQTSTGTW